MATNKFAVGARGARICVSFQPLPELTADDALNLASWLVTMAYALDPGEDPEGSIDATMERLTGLVLENLES